MVRTASRVALVVAVLVVGLGLSAASAAADRDDRDTLTVVERATTDTVVDIGTPGDSIGDSLAFGNDIYNAANNRVVGRDEGFCVRTNPGLAWECTFTTILTRGSLTVQGPFYDDLRDSTFAVTGGTGRFRDARGDMTLHARNALGTEFDFVFRLIR